MTRREYFYLGLILMLGAMALMTGCETISFIRERGKPVRTDSDRFARQIVWEEPI